MDVDSIVSIAREGMKLAFLIGAPVLLVGVVVGLVVGIVQAVTQIQDQTVSFVIKISSMALTFTLFLPWIVEKLADYSRELLENIPETATFFLQ